MAQLLVAMKLLQAGRFAEAEQRFRRVLATPGAAAEVAAVAGLAMVLKATGRAPEARTLLAASLGRLPADAVLLGTLGTVLQDLGDDVAAAASFRAALVLQPGSTPALNNLALSQARSERLAAAVRSWDRALVARPDFSEARLNLLSTLQRARDHQGLRRRAAAGLRYRPSDPGLWLYRARAERGMRNVEGARTALAAGLALDPAAGELWAEWADSAGEAGGTAPAAARACARRTVCDPDNAAAWYNLGVALGRARDLRGATAAFRGALARRRDFPEARSNLAQTLLADRRFDAALPLLRAVVRDDPTDHRAAAALAAELRRRGDAAGCRRLLSGILRRHPAFAAALLQLSHVEAGRGFHDQAVTAARRAACSAPDLPEVQRRVADLYRDRRLWDAAIRHYDHCLALTPGSSEAFCQRYHSRVECRIRPEGAIVDDPRHADLTRLVATAVVSCPDGYPSLQAFNAAASAFGQAHPSLSWEPDRKTTRHGAQTRPTLLAGGRDAMRDALRRLVLERVEAYLHALRSAGLGVLDGMRPDALGINMWCVVLEPGGHQLTHNHPAGWISGVYYLEIPESVGAAAGVDGCIEFGRPHAGDYPSADRHPVLTVRPEPGLMVMFPSALYHRTFPFRSGRRVCLAFDVVPGNLEFRD